ncbi:ly-6-related protein domain-containing protein [Ditylenchus destructor]|uniref:Ly-6-related protein domain-containing protein n=1 Tax=Ditylenchus destructor TaxID=166010 RepID=A0AAD4N4K1_9BILA|nr:ly-6-related protein domain-containing protein [Ditylenchus destructor]
MELISESTPASYRYPTSISCFSCASEEYEKLYARSENVYTFGQPMQFEKACDNRLDLENFTPTIRCDSSCITVLEPQFFGGILNEKKPYTYVRGCATDIFAVANSVANAAVEAIGMDESAISHRLPPAEIDFLHRADICLSLPIQELWPELFTGTGGIRNAELVKVCACTTSACNTHDALTAGALPRSTFSILVINLFLISIIVPYYLLRK